MVVAKILFTGSQKLFFEGITSLRNLILLCKLNEDPSLEAQLESFLLEKIYVAL